MKCWGLASFLDLTGQKALTVDFGTGQKVSQIDVKYTNFDASVVSLGSLPRVCAVLEGGQVKCFGSFMNFSDSNSSSKYAHTGWSLETDYGDNMPYLPLPTSCSAVAVAVGSYHQCVLCNNGKILCSGYSPYNGRIEDIMNETQLGENWEYNDLGLANSETVTDICAMQEITFVVTSNGTVRCFGDNSEGQCGIGYVTSSIVGSVVVPLGSNFSATQIACGYRHGLYFFILCIHSTSMRFI